MSLNKAMIHIFTLINIKLFCRYLSVSGVRVRGSGRFCRSVKESLNGPVQANRSDDTKSGIGTERKNIPGFRINMYINTFSFNPEITGKSGHSNGIRITFLLPLIHMNLRSIPFIFRTMRHSRISYGNHTQ